MTTKLLFAGAIVWGSILTFRHLWRRPPETLESSDIGSPLQIKKCGKTEFRTPGRSFLSSWNDLQFKLGERPGGATTEVDCEITRKFQESVRHLQYFCKQDALVLLGGDKREVYGWCSRPGAGGNWGIYDETRNAGDLADWFRSQLDCS